MIRSDIIHLVSFIGNCRIGVTRKARNRVENELNYHYDEIRKNQIGKAFS